MTLMEYLKGEGVSATTLKHIVEFRQGNTSKDPRVPLPKAFFRGPALNKLLVAVLAGYNVLLEGAKGVGKNTLIDTAAYILKRPVYQFPFNQSVDAASIVGADTLDVSEDGANIITFRKHQLVEAMEHPDGAWFVGDEINMTRADVTAVLHMATDYRRELDYPGMGRVQAHPAFRFIGTMNYGYMGTQELNEAFGDRFVVINVDSLNAINLATFLQTENADLFDTAAMGFAKLYHTLDDAAKTGTISSRAVSMRGIQQAIDLHRCGLGRGEALDMGVISKAFDAEERTQVRDLIQVAMSEKDAWLNGSGKDGKATATAPVSSPTQNAVKTETMTIDLSNVAKKR